MSRDTSPVRDIRASETIERPTLSDQEELNTIRQLFLDEYFKSEHAKVVRTCLGYPIVLSITEVGSTGKMRTALKRELERMKQFKDFMTGPPFDSQKNHFSRDIMLKKRLEEDENRKDRIKDLLQAITVLDREYRNYRREKK